MLPFLTINTLEDIKATQQFLKSSPIEVGGFLLLPENSSVVSSLHSLIQGRKETFFANLPAIHQQYDEIAVLAFEHENPFNVDMMAGTEISHVLKAFARGIPYFLLSSQDMLEAKATGVLEVAIGQGWLIPDADYKLRFIVDVDKPDEVLRLASAGVTAFAMKPELALHLF